MTREANDYFRVHAGHVHPLEEAIHRGRLTCYVRTLPQDFKMSPELKTLHAIGREALTYELLSCLRAWLGDLLPVESVRQQGLADVVLGCARQAGPGNYADAMKTGWLTKQGGTSWIWMDYFSTRWHRTESRLGLWPSFLGTWRIPVRTLLLHECGHALGIDHTEGKGSIMDGPGNELQPANPLHTVSMPGLPALSAADREAFGYFFARVKGGMGV